MILNSQTFADKTSFPIPFEVITKMSEAVEKALFAMHQANINPHQITEKKKSDSSWLLSLDVTCQEIVLETLSELPFPVISEEITNTHDLLFTENSYFLCDPIDGTSAARRYFYSGLPSSTFVGGFGCLLGLVLDGNLSISMYGSFFHSKIYLAIKGLGIFYKNFNKSFSSDILPENWYQLNLNYRSNSDLYSIRLADDFNNKDKSYSLNEEGFHFSKETANSMIENFFISTGYGNEGHIAQSLKNKGVIVNYRKLGGFAHDILHMVYEFSSGFQSGALQMKVAPWDFSATLFLIEANFDIIMAPIKGSCHDFFAIDWQEWQIQFKNPLLVLPKNGKKLYWNQIQEIIEKEYFPEKNPPE